MQITQELFAIGLSDKEADVYVAALQLGYSSVSEIAQKAGINRTTAYTYIKNLISRGLINAVERNAKIYYVAEKPDKLKYIYEQQEKEIQRKRVMLDKLMPELESIYNLAKEKPSVKYYNYKENLEMVRREIVDLRADEMFNIFNYERYHEYINRDHIRNLLNSTERFSALYIAKSKAIDRRILPFLKNEKFKLKFLPEAKFGFLCEILIANDRVYIASDFDSLLISDKLFSQTLKLLFHALWGIAEEI